MSFFNFRSQNKFADISKILSQNEQTSRASLHEKHPHTKDIFARNNIDLQQIRKKSVNAAAAATVLGAFLSFPHLLGTGHLNEQKVDANTRTLSIEKQIEQPKINQNQGHGNVNQTPNVSVNLPTNPVPTNPATPEDKKSQGHIHGRSYLAPPKDHGYHDLGLHKGEDLDKGKAESPGPHPQDLGVNHPEKPQ